MNELRNDDNLTTADLVNPQRTQTGGPTPRQSFAESNTSREAGATSNAFAPDANDMKDVPAAASAETPAMRNASVGEPAGTATSSGNGQPGPLFPEDELHNFRARWDQVQTSFVDEPRHAVEQADSLVANVVKRIAEQFANERAALEKQWDRGDDVNTEELRQAFKRYRAFFDRLLAF